MIALDKEQSQPPASSKRRLDLLLIAILAILILPLAVFGKGIVLIALGLIYALFCPGYTLVSALFPRKNDLDILERLALSFSLSIALTAFISLILNFTPLGLRIFTLLPAFSLFTLATAAVAWLRCQGLPAEECFRPKLFPSHIFSFDFWQAQGRLTVVLSALLVVIVASTLGWLIYLETLPRMEEKATDFYILGPQGKAENYPYKLTMGDKAKLVAGIINRGDSQQDYRIEIAINDEKVAEYPLITLLAGQQLEQEISFPGLKPGKQQRVEVSLYERSETKPAKSLQFWIDVVDRG